MAKLWILFIPCERRRRLGLDAPDQEVHRETMDRFTRLASSIFKCVSNLA